MQMGRDRHLGFQAGVGPVVTTLPCLPRSYEHAVGALNLAKRKGEKLLNYEDFGIYKIIMDVQDRKMLDRYCREMLALSWTTIRKSRQTTPRYSGSTWRQGAASGRWPRTGSVTGTPFTTSSRKSGSFCRWIWTIW